ncbi:MAG TPA: DNA-binding protein YbiB, partial [Burkholderiales bacterium]|nr:DNA-binding protein YbiB [Burkholderiales bacterium]
MLQAGSGPQDLTEQEAYQLGATMLDGGVPDLELGALLVALRVKGPSLEEWLGLIAALSERVHRLRTPAPGVRP